MKKLYVVCVLDPQKKDVHKEAFLPVMSLQAAIDQIRNYASKQCLQDYEILSFSFDDSLQVKFVDGKAFIE